MPTVTQVNDLKINKLTKAQYDAAVQAGTIGENEISIITDLDATPQVDSLPTAGASQVGKIYQYTGATDANYTNGYFYKCISSGSPAVYSWQQVNVQPSVDPLPSQSGNAGKFLKTDGTDASWGDALVNTATGNNSLTIGGTAATGFMATNIGSGTQASSQGTALGTQSQAIGTQSIAIGISAVASQTRSIQIGNGANNDPNTVKISNVNGNFEMMSADGTIPEARLADTTSATEGQVLQLDSNNNAVWADQTTVTFRTWVEE